MKLIDIRSALAGAGLVAGIFGLVSMMTVPPYHVFHNQTEGVPTPNQMARIHQTDTPYTVPAGKLFVATGVYQGGTTGSFAATISFDATKVLRLGTGNEIAPGLAAAPGTVITFVGPDVGDEALLLGYLADI